MPAQHIVHRLHNFDDKPVRYESVIFAMIFARVSPGKIRRVKAQINGGQNQRNTVWILMKRGKSTATPGVQKDLATCIYNLSGDCMYRMFFHL